MHLEWSGAIVWHDEACKIWARNRIGARIAGKVVLAVIELCGEARFKLAKDTRSESANILENGNVKSWVGQVKIENSFAYTWLRHQSRFSDLAQTYRSAGA